jgi:hypothetical protein
VKEDVSHAVDNDKNRSRLRRRRFNTKFTGSCIVSIGASSLIKKGGIDPLTTLAPPVEHGSARADPGGDCVSSHRNAISLLRCRVWSTGS